MLSCACVQIVSQDEAAEHSTTATLGPDLAAPGSGRDQSPVNVRKKFFSENFVLRKHLH